MFQDEIEILKLIEEGRRGGGLGKSDIPGGLSIERGSIFHTVFFRFRFFCKLHVHRT